MKRTLPITLYFKEEQDRPHIGLLDTTDNLLNMKPSWFLQPKCSILDPLSSNITVYYIISILQLFMLQHPTLPPSLLYFMNLGMWEEIMPLGKQTRKIKKTNKTKQTILLCAKTSTYWKGKHQTWIRNSIWKRPFFSTHNILPNKGYYLSVQTLFHILQLSCLQQY